MNLFIFLLICALVLIPIILMRKNSPKKHLKQGPTINNIFELPKSLLEEINEYNNQETKIIFLIFKEKKADENTVNLFCDWLTEKIQIKYGENNNKIEVDYQDKENSYNSESYHMIKLLFDKKEITFNIHILLHQINIFNLFIDKYEEKTFSLEQIFYSKNKTKFSRIKKKTNDLMKKRLNCEDYQDQYFMRCNYINITKNYLVDILFHYGGKLDKEKEEIFEKQNPNLFLNILFGDEKEAQIHFFLNDEIQHYKINENDYIFLDSFYEKFITSKFYKLSKNKRDEYFYKLYSIIEKEYQNNEKNVDDNNNIDDDSSIGDEINKLQIDYQKKFKKYIHYVDKKFLFYLACLLSNKRKLKEKDIIIAEKICLLSLCLIEFPYKKIKRFYKLKKKFFKIDNISLYDKLKIMISLKSFLTFENYENSFIDIVEYNKLTGESPFIQGYLFYKKIIENLKQESLLTFFYNQLNSGEGFDYMSNTNCYKLKYIPLNLIKIHLLFNYNDNKYFFIYEKNTNKNAFTESYSKDIFFNLSSIKIVRPTFYNPKKHNLENDSIKIGLIHLHENSHSKFRRNKTFNMKSPRGLLQSDLKLFYNDYITFEYNNNEISNFIKHGESGKALEYILFKDNDAISQLLIHENLEELNNYNLYIQDNNLDLIKIKDEILNQNTYSYLNKKFDCKASSPSKKIKELNFKKKNIYDTIIIS